MGGIAWRQGILELAENKSLVFVEAAHFSYDGTVKLELSDKRELKLAAAPDVTLSNGLMKIRRTLSSALNCVIRDLC